MAVGQGGDRDLTSGGMGGDLSGRPSEAFAAQQLNSLKKQPEGAPEGLRRPTGTTALSGSILICFFSSIEMSCFSAPLVFAAAVASGSYPWVILIISA